MQSQSFGGVNIHVPTNTYTQVVVYWRREMTDIYTCSYPSLILPAQTRIHIGARLYLALPGSLPLHTQTSNYLQEICLMMTYTHTHNHTHASQLAQTHTLTGAFPLHARNSARSLHTYLTSVGRVFLVEIVVLETSGRGAPVFQFLCNCD